MALNFAETKTKKTYPRIGEGTYPARIIRMIDLGVQHNTNFKTSKPQYHVLDDQGKWAKSGNNFLMTDEPNDSPDLSPKLWMDFELPTETIEVDGIAKPRWIGKEYTVSSNEKALIMKVFAAADPSGKATLKYRNAKGLLGLPLMITIGSTSSDKDKITNVSSLVKGMTVDPLANPTLFFDLDGNDRKTFDSLPDWMKKRIQEGIGYLDTPFAKSASSFADMADDEVEESPY